MRGTTGRRRPSQVRYVLLTIKRVESGKMTAESSNASTEQKKRRPPDQWKARTAEAPERKVLERVPISLVLDRGTLLWIPRPPHICQYQNGLITSVGTE